jgi:hypothetical protein
MFASKAEQRRIEWLKNQKKDVDIFNQLCSCKHQADEHIAGDGHCFRCDCDKFNPVEKLS